ncbi:TRAP transporter large permease subunit [Polynucleobacter sp. 30F-ANTBAC]|uniref:TRAP transporter large permease n=1 Tax=Polynucleobacter sp. 30F-ANTBAC TaxID=2689095 RepID=UPI001C0C5C18|nr:TRAP transporter large permease subunit [Polynucleobacter sp. 30F-ANTBAC]MBU3599351.1 TRAP transporter large permease subunit [Polynucleobacter sp. 30F-ANTBAC]
MRKELYFGFSIMAAIVVGTLAYMPSFSEMTNGHLGLLMLSLVVVTIMMGFPTAFTLMGMGMLFAFFAFHNQGEGDAQAIKRTLDLMVQRTFSVMTNDVLVSIPLFVFMGYLVERANLIEKLFKSLHLSLARVPGALAVATLVTCAIFATATGIVGAVVTLMGLLALPAMLKAGYNVKLSAGVITAGGCLGILIPPSVMLIVYGATAGVSVVKLYAGAFFPGLMLAALYIGYVIIVAKLKPEWAPPLSEKDRHVNLTPASQKLATFGKLALPAVLAAAKGRAAAGISTKELLKQLAIIVGPLLLFVVMMTAIHRAATPIIEQAAVVTMESDGGMMSLEEAPSSSDDNGLAPPPGSEEAPVAMGVALPPGAEEAKAPVAATATATAPAAEADKAPAERQPTPMWFWIMLGIGLAIGAVFYYTLTMARLEIFKMLLGSFFPLAILILFVLGTIVFGLATPTEAAAVGSLGGFILAWAYKQLNMDVVRESVFLTAKTSAMVCWLFVGSSIFSAAFALLGGQQLIEQWVLGLGLTTFQFLVLSQVIIFLLGWPLEWTEIIVIFMPIFIPLLAHYNVDPLFFGLLVALNLQTAFLSPPVAMAAFYLKGVSPPHVTLNQIFAGMMPFMAIQVFALVILYAFPAIGMWLPGVLYK